MNTYGIRPDYVINPQAAESPYEDTWENSRTYQYWVYERLIELAEPGCSILDLGCGYGWKLRYWVQDTGAYITGMDLPEVIEYCVREHDFGNWASIDLSVPPPSPAPAETPKYDLIVCADVIEHLPNPDLLLEWIRHFSHEGTLALLSTPNRELVYGPDHLGPPANPSHFREWGWDELSNYIEDAGFTVLSHEHLPPKKDVTEVPSTQMIVAVP